MSAPSPEMVALVDAFGVASVKAVADDPTLGAWADSRERLLAAIARLEAENARVLGLLDGEIEIEMRAARAKNAAIAKLESAQAAAERERDDVRETLAAAMTAGRWHAEGKADAERRRAALVGAVEVALADLDAPIREALWREGGRGGQHVLYTGPLASVCHVPNVRRDLERIANPLRAALPAKDPTS